MAGGHVCSLDPNCHDHSLLKTIDNTAKWWSGLLTSEVLLHRFQKLRIHYSKIWLKSFLNATVSLGRVGTNKQKQKTVTLGEEVTKGGSYCTFWSIKKEIEFLFSSKFNFLKEGEQLPQKGMLSECFSLPTCSRCAYTLPALVQKGWCLKIYMSLKKTDQIKDVEDCQRNP